MCTNWYICLTSNCDIFVSHNHIMHKSTIFGPRTANLSLLNLDQSIFLIFFMWTAEQLLRNKVAFHPFANTTEPIKMCVVCNIIMLTLFYSFGRRCQLPRWIIMELCRQRSQSLCKMRILCTVCMIVNFVSCSFIGCTVLGVALFSVWRQSWLRI